MLIKKLKAWQLEAVAKLRKVRVGALFMDMGTGKTITSFMLGKIRMDAGKVDKIIYLVPSSLVRQHYKELSDNLDLFTVSCFMFNEKTTEEKIPKASVYLCTIEGISMSNRIYLALEKLVDEKTFLIVDESELIKNDCLRTHRIISLGEKTQYKLILSGLPVSEGIENLYYQFAFLDKRILGYPSFGKFASAHLEFELERENKVRKRHNEEYLTARISPYSYTCKKEKVLKLPKKVEHEISFCSSGEQKNLYKETKKEILGGRINGKTIFLLFTRLQQASSGITGEGEIFDKSRVLALKEKLTEKSEEQFIVFCKYTAEVDAIIKEIAGCGRVDGKSIAKERAKTIEQHRKGEIKYLIVNYQAGAYGLNLMHCNNVVYFSQQFRYSLQEQASSRIHRLGQEKQCNYYYMVGDLKIDTIIKNCLKKKQNLVEIFSEQMEELKKTMTEEEAEKRIKEELEKNI